MIEYQVNAAYAVRDALVGRSLGNPALYCIVDGKIYHPVIKDDGMVIFYNLPEGRHTLEFRYPGYFSEQIELEVSDKTEISIISMKPDTRYGEHKMLCELKVSNLEAGKIYWMTTGMQSLKLMQAATDSDEKTVRLFAKYGMRYPLPLMFLILGGNDAEVCTMVSRDGEMWEMTDTLKKTHKRGAIFHPCVGTHAEEDGTIVMFYSRPMDVTFYDGDKLHTISIKEGKNTWAYPS